MAGLLPETMSAVPSAAVAEDAVHMAGLIASREDGSCPWQAMRVEGMERFLVRFIRLAEALPGDRNSLAPTVPASKSLRRALHEAIRDVIAFLPDGNFAEAMDALMRCLPAFEKARPLPPAEFSEYVRCLYPVAPGVATALHQRLSAEMPGIAAIEVMPAWDPAALRIDEVTLDVRLNNRSVGSITVAVDAPEEAIRAMALNLPALTELLGDAGVAKIVVVPGRLVNVVPGPP